AAFCAASPSDLKRPRCTAGNTISCEPMALPCHRHRKFVSHCSARMERTFRLLLYDALASEAMSTLATGVFLTRYALALGASSLAIGVLAAVPSAVQFLQFPAAVLVERIRRRRAISVWAASIGRLFLIVAALAPMVAGRGAVILLIVSIAVWQASQ